MEGFLEKFAIILPIALAWLFLMNQQASG